MIRGTASIVATVRSHEEPPGIRTRLSMTRIAKAHQPASARFGDAGVPITP